MPRNILPSFKKTEEEVGMRISVDLVIWTTISNSLVDIIEPRACQLSLQNNLNIKDLPETRILVRIRRDFNNMRCRYLPSTKREQTWQDEAWGAQFVASVEEHFWNGIWESLEASYSLLHGSIGACTIDGDVVREVCFGYSEGI